jgi:hypothetical protein
VGGTFVVPAGVFYIRVDLFAQSSGTGLANDRCVVDRARLQNVGAFPMNAQQGALPVQTPWASVGSFTTVGNGNEFFDTSAVGPGAMTLGITVEANRHLGLLSVTGKTTNTVYEVSSPSPRVGGFVTVPINASRDSTYRIQWSTSDGVGTKVDADVSSTTFGYPTLGQGTMGESVSVAVAVDQTPAPWQAPKAVPSGGAGDLTYVAGVAQQFVYGFDWNVDVTAVGTGGTFQLIGTVSGTIYDEIYVGALGNFTRHYSGAQFPIGDGLKGLRSGTPTLRSVLTYSQA